MASEIRMSYERDLDVRGRVLDQILTDLDAMGDPDFVDELLKVNQVLDARAEEHRENMEFLYQRHLMHLRRMRISVAVVALCVFIQLLAHIMQWAS